MFPDENRYKDEYKDYEKAELLPVATPEVQLKRLTATLINMGQLIQKQIMPIVERLCKSLCPLINELNKIVNSYPNKRVIYLATHGKRRVRKKNINRIKKWYEREAKNADR